MEAIKRAIKALRLSVSSINPVKDSYSSTVRILDLENGQRVVIKIPYTKVKLLREERALKLLADNPLVPEILDIWYGDEHVVGALLLSYIDGQPMELPVNDDVIYDMGRKLAMIHEVKVDRFELDEKERDWSLSVRKKIESWVIEIKAYLTPSMLDDIDKYLNDHIMCLNRNQEPCLIHFDYRPGNILIRNGEIVGIIDYENARGGSAEIDFTKVSNTVWRTHSKGEKMFLDGYRSIRALPELEKVLPVYKFYHAIGGIAWCVRRERTDGDFFEENFNQLEAILRCST